MSPEPSDPPEPPPATTMGPVTTGWGSQDFNHREQWGPLGTVGRQQHRGWRDSLGDTGTAQGTRGSPSGCHGAGDPSALQATRGPGPLVKVLLAVVLGIVEVPSWLDDGRDVPTPLCSQFLGQSHGRGSPEGPPHSTAPHTTQLGRGSCPTLPSWGRWLVSQCPQKGSRHCHGLIASHWGRSSVHRGVTMPSESVLV